MEREIAKIHRTYRCMLSRCYNPKHVGYRNYGGRGITVCDEWLNSREAFVDWALRSGHAMHLSLDRIDNDKGYSPENCRWATAKEQLNNQRRNHRIVFDGVEKTLSQWAEHFGLKPDTLLKRLQRMPVEQAFSAGPLRAWRHGTRAGYESHGCRCDLCRASNAERHRKRRAMRSNARRAQVGGVEVQHG